LSEIIKVYNLEIHFVLFFFSPLFQLKKGAYTISKGMSLIYTSTKFLRVNPNAMNLFLGSPIGENE
jgi:hypothetical protein